MWSGKFGDDYTSRCNPSPQNRKKFFQKILDKHDIQSVCEVGANKGTNLEAIHLTDPTIELTAIEINKKAHDCIAPYINTFHINLLNFEPKTCYDLVLSCGFLIHVSPAHLNQTYKKLLSLSHKYILICEYFHPQPITVIYRNNFNLLFIRDFAKEIIDQLDVHLINNGFLWKHLNPNWDNLHWWLFKKGN